MSERRKFTDYEKKTVYEKYNGKCAICGQPVSKNKMVISHKVPLSKGGSNALDNIQLACWSCAQAKQNLSTDEFLQKVYRIALHNRKDIIMFHMKHMFVKGGVL